MNPQHPRYRKIALGRTSVLAAVWERKGEWVHEAEIAQVVTETWDDPQGNVLEHLAVLAQHGAVEERASDRGGHEYRDEGILDDWIVEAGLEAICEEASGWNPTGEVSAGRWLLMLGSQVIATASSLEALRLGQGREWPKHAVAIQVGATHRVRRAATQSRSVAL